MFHFSFSSSGILQRKLLWDHSKVRFRCCSYPPLVFVSTVARNKKKKRIQRTEQWNLNPGPLNASPVFYHGAMSVLETYCKLTLCGSSEESSEDYRNNNQVLHYVNCIIRRSSNAPTHYKSFRHNFLSSSTTASRQWDKQVTYFLTSV